MEGAAVVISIKSLKEAEELTHLLSHVVDDFDLAQGRYIVNAKSIMGVCSLDFDEEMALSCATMSDRDLENLVARFLRKETVND